MLQIFNFFVDQTPLTLNVKLKLFNISYDENCRDTTPPSISNFKINIKN